MATLSVSSSNTYAYRQLTPGHCGAEAWLQLQLFTETQKERYP